MDDLLVIFDVVSEGSTFPGVELEVYEEIAVEGSVDPTLIPVDLTGASIIMNCVKSNMVHAIYSTDNGKLVIGTTEIINGVTQSVTHKIIMPEHIPTLTHGTYDFDFNITLASDDKITGFAKGQWKITNPITKL